jgi:hypothetical protein
LTVFDEALSVDHLFALAGLVDTLRCKYGV